MQKKLLMDLTISKKGLTCMWERGGGFTNIGNSTLICDRNGKAKHAIHIQKKGELACGSHALIPVRNGDYVIMAEHDRFNVEYTVYKIISARKSDAQATLEMVDHVPYNLLHVVEVAVEKSYDYHCRTPYYIKVDDCSVESDESIDEEDSLFEDIDEGDFEEE